MSYMIDMLETKESVDQVIRNTRDKVLCLSFIRSDDSSCLKLLDIVSNSN